MRGGEYDVGNPRVRGVTIRDRQRDRGMRIDEIAGFSPGGPDRSAGFAFARAAGVEFRAELRKHRVGQHEAAGLL